MEVLLSVLIAILVSTGVYCLLQPNLARIVSGIFLLANAANLVLFVASGMSERIPPIIESGEKTLEAGAANSLSQAMIILSIIMGFGMMACLLLLCREFFKDQKDDNLSPRSFE